MGPSQVISSASLQNKWPMHLCAIIGLMCIEPSYAQVSAENRPAIKLIASGVRYVAPAGWRVEDEPDLKGVLLLEPARAEAKPEVKVWRSRILVELNERPASELSGLSLPAQAADKLVSVLKAEGKAKDAKQMLVQHPTGYSYGWYESKQTRQGFEIIETRLVMLLPENQRLVITASCHPEAVVKGAPTGCETFKPDWEAFVRSVALRKGN
jgi:hypothetical protein